MFGYVGGEDFVHLSRNDQAVTGEFNCVTVALLNDTVYEDNEQFILTVVVNDTVSLPDPHLVEGTVAVTILDNDGTCSLNTCYAELLYVTSDLLANLLKHYLF